MSKALSLKLQDNIYQDAEVMRGKVNMPRNTYINKAVDYFNKMNRKRFLKKQLAKECKLGKDSALEVLHEFEQLDDNLFDWE
jgi:hypothetical protein